MTCTVGGENVKEGLQVRIVLARSRIEAKRSVRSQHVLLNSLHDHFQLLIFHLLLHATPFQSRIDQ